MGTANVMKRKYQRVLPYGKKKIDGKLRLKDDILIKAERGQSYSVCNGITATMDYW